MEIRLTPCKRNSTRFKKNFVAWFTKLSTWGVTYLNEPTVDAADPYLDEFDKVTTKGNKVLERWISAGMELFEAKLAAGDEVEDDLTYFVTKIMARKFERYQFPEAFKMADRLVKLNPENLFAEVYRGQGRAANQSIRYNRVLLS